MIYLFLFMNKKLIILNTNIGDYMNVLITGGASNIALEVAKNLSLNNKIYLTTHTDRQCEYLKEKINNANIICFKMDVNKDLNKIDKLNIDCLISHAGIGIGGSILGMDIKYLRENFETNFFSNFKLIKKVYDKFEKQGHGKIFVTSSLASIIPIPMLGCYCSSKAAISMLTNTINQELKIIKSNIKISLIEPGAYHTGFNQVMINNKEKYLNKESKFYKQKELFTKLQILTFKLLEKKKIDTIVNKIVKEVESDNPKFHIKSPLLQTIGTKIYMLLFR